MQIFLMNRDFDIVAVMDQAVRIEVRRKFFSPGSIRVKFPPHTVLPGEAYYVYCVSVNFYCALIERKERLEDGSVEVSGRMLEALLERRIIKGECLYDGRVDTCVFDAVKNNAILNRGIPYLQVSLADAFTEKVVSDASWKNLSDWSYTVLRPFGAAYRVTLDTSAKTLRLSIERGADRTRDQSNLRPVIFSERLGNVENVTVDYNENGFANVAYVEGADGTYVRYPYNIEGVLRREIYVSAKDIYPEHCATDAEYKEKLNARGAEKLSFRELSVKVSADLVGGDYYSGMFYDLGDLCEVELSNGQYYKARLTEICEVTEGGHRMTRVYFGNDPISLTEMKMEEAFSLLT